MLCRLAVLVLLITIICPAQQALSYNPPGNAGGEGHGKFWHRNPAGLVGGAGKGWNYNPPGPGRTCFRNR